MLIRHQLFIDESGYGQTGPQDAFVFGGFLSTVRAWERFAHVWKGLLKKPPVLSAGGFKNHLRRNRNSRRLKDFIEVLRISGVHRVSTIIPRQAYQRAILDELPKWRGRLDDEVVELLGNEYYFGFFHIVMHVLLPMTWVNDKLRLEVIYDLNVQEKEKLKAGYQGLVDHVPEARFLAGEPHGEPDDDVMPLLAADLIAWHLHRDYVERLLGKEHEDTIWEALKGLSTYPESTLNESDLRSMAQWERVEQLYLERSRTKRANVSPNR